MANDNCSIVQINGILDGIRNQLNQEDIDSGEQASEFICCLTTATLNRQPNFNMPTVVIEKILIQTLIRNEKIYLSLRNIEIAKQWQNKSIFTQIMQILHAFSAKTGIPIWIDDVINSKLVDNQAFFDKFGVQKIIYQNTGYKRPRICFISKQS